MFDPRAAKALQPGDHLTLDQAPGLRLVATATRRTWIYRFKSPADGRMRQVKLGNWPAMGLPAALSAWQEQRDARLAGADVVLQKRERRASEAAARAGSRYTVAKACAEYLASYAGHVTPKTYAEAHRILDGELGDLADRPAASITRADAFDLLSSKAARPVLAARLRQLLGAVWDRALDSGRLAPDVPNWWRLVLRGKLASKGKIVGGKHQGVEKRALTEAEVAKLLPWLPNFTRDIEDAITLYLWTGCRGSEIVAMERAEITDESTGLWWTVPKAKLKMRRNPLTTDLRVPLVGRAGAIVRRRLAATEGRYLFPSRGKTGHIEQKAVGVAVWMHMPGNDLRKEWVRPRLPVEGWAPHDLRRTARTMLAALGCPANVAEAILGHLPPGIQAVYDRHQYDAERRHWLKQLDARLEALAVGKVPSA